MHTTQLTFDQKKLITTWFKRETDTLLMEDSTIKYVQGMISPPQDQQNCNSKNGVRSLDQIKRMHEISTRQHAGNAV